MTTFKIIQYSDYPEEYTVIVDSEDYEKVSKHVWRIAKIKTKRAIKVQIAVHTTINNKTVKLHRFIMDAPVGTDVDHKNVNTLDNRKENLRICTRSNNLMNSRKYSRRKPCSSKYKGVSWHKGANKWESGLQVEGKRKWLGLFDSEIEAAMAYNEAATKHYGEFARLNDITP